MHFRSRDTKDGGHTVTILSVISENPMLHANFTTLSSIQPELLPIKVLYCGIGYFALFCCCDLDLDLDRMTFIYELDLYPPKISPQIKQTFFVKVFESYRHTYIRNRQTDRRTDATETITTPFCGW